MSRFLGSQNDEIIKPYRNFFENHVFYQRVRQKIREKTFTEVEIVIIIKIFYLKLNNHKLTIIVFCKMHVRYKTICQICLGK